MVCKNCGKELKNGASICGSCGAKVELSNEKIEVDYPDEIALVDPPVITESHTFVDEGEFLENVQSVVDSSSNNNNNSKKRKEKKKKNEDVEEYSDEIEGTWEEKPPKKSFAIWIFVIVLIGIIGCVFYFVIWPNITFQESGDDVVHILEKKSDFFSTNEWTNDEYMILGKLYRLHDSYKSLEDDGWGMDEEFLIQKGGLLLGSGEKYSSNVGLIKTEYPYGNFQVGLVNLSSGIKSLRDCEVWNVVINNQNAIVPIPFMLPGGIQNGSSNAEIVAAYGNLPDSQVERVEELKYTIYHYSYDYSQYLDLMVYDDGGLLQVNYRHF